MFNNDGLQAIMLFENGYGVSVVRSSTEINDKTIYFSYTRDETEWELAVIRKADNSRGWDLEHSTPITNDVICNLSDEGVTEVMRKVQQLERTEI